MAEPVRVTVLRHGEVAGPAHVFRGRSDPPLTARGSEQMRAALADRRFDAVATSPLLRCRAFAEAFAAEQGIACRVLADMRELDFGDWEGLSGAEVAERDPAAYQRFRSRCDDCAASGGERIGDFRRRVLAAWQDWLADAAGGQRLLITHAGVMRILLQQVLKLPASGLYRIALPEAAQFQVSLLAGEAPILLSLNPCADFS
ncbi:alpha-ribazole phosphatase [Sulfuritortus calidifontis]|uniref:Alpha-ribazole phosphatase n=1 Tax=Sulfuritortus calidifontis TaxID=1914471 RepID=A0A4R3K0T3_9PROT|nr:histidine phosphatase family protein [Sulfuritortus calidifontis]TCS73939.1 alpha-ribazole phosphatase [Sulfuritortus calidifontis]